MSTKQQAVAAIKLPVVVCALQERAAPRFIRDARDYLIDCPTPEIARQIAHALNSLPGLVGAAKAVQRDVEAAITSGAMENVVSNGTLELIEAALTATEKGMV